MCLVLLCLNLQAAGPGSGGGGDTINPIAVEPDAVMMAVEEYGFPGIVGWLHGAENKYRRSQDPKNDPYVKLFAGPKTIYDILKTTPVELRFKEPCYDVSGQAKDGSIYAYKSGAICLSPFLMAPKLGETNVKEQTLALVLHEMSHLLGTTEDEAIRIQNDILLDFTHIDFDDFWQKTTRAHNAMMSLLHSIDDHIQNPSKFSSADFTTLVESIASKNEDIETTMRFGGSFSTERFMMMSPQMEDKMEANLCVVTNLNNAVYATDPHQTADMRHSYQEQLDSAFRGQNEITATSYYNNAVCIDAEKNPEFDNLRIRRIDNQSDLLASLQQEEDFLSILWTNMEDYIVGQLQFIELR